MNPIKNRIVGSTKLKVTEIGFGAASLGNLYQEVLDATASSAIDEAVATGLHYFDTAPHYGQGLSERRVGDVLRRHRDTDWVLSTKVGRLLKPAGYAETRHAFVSPMPFDIHYDYSYDGIMRSFEDSQQRLGLDQIDILYVHDIGKATHGADNARHQKDLETSGYRALDELRSNGQIQAIGLGVNESEICEWALDHGDYDCFLLAGRYTLLEQEALSSFIPKCQKRNTSLIIGGPYNSGILATGTQHKGTIWYNYEPATDDVIKRVAKIESFCQKYNIKLAAAALQFPLAHEVVASVIPGLGSDKRVTETIKLYKEVIPSEFWSDLKEAGLIREDAPTP